GQNRRNLSLPPHLPPPLPDDRAKTLALPLLLTVPDLRVPRPISHDTSGQPACLPGRLYGLASGQGHCRTARGGLGLGLWGFTWSVGWDYVKNYAWREVSYDDLYGAITDANELLRRLGDLIRTDSGEDRADWVGRNYQNVLGISSSLLKRLLNVFRQSGTLRKVVETVETEVVDGGFLKDCLEVGTNDLKGLLQIFKDMALQFHSSSSGNEWRDL
ncbi:hypothetical protein F2P56_007088, partial [Juglans regia]